MASNYWLLMDFNGSERLVIVKFMANNGWHTGSYAQEECLRFATPKPDKQTTSEKYSD